ncbi:MAG: hypothetical protein PHH96_06075 [Smithellaceae bacterium]|jgi:itaconate CoA-transferase|nr:hypothetical protein [Smithellaceae bacterium]HBL53088.1 hypothetical protein [Syntrophaceae bacterium]
MFEQEYQDKLTTPEKAVLSIPDNGFLAHGNLQAEPPALLKAIEERLRSNDLKKLRVFHLGTSVYASKTILSPEMVDCVEAYLWTKQAIFPLAPRLISRPAYGNVRNFALSK